MNEVAPQILRHVLDNLSIFLIRDALLDLFTETEKIQAHFVGDNLAIPDGHCWIYTGKLLSIDDYLYSIVGVEGVTLNKGAPVTVSALGMATEKTLCRRNSSIILHAGDIANYTDVEELPTTMGRLLLNYVILVDPFGPLVPYINNIWRIGPIEESFMFESLRQGKITVDQVKHYSRNLHWLGHFTELAVPSFSERSLTVDPRILARRDELLKEHHDEIVAGNAVIMNKIETELIAMDKESLKGDESTLFYDNDNKSYEIHRKMMLVSGGMVPEFGGKGYNFIGGSLEEGWDIKNFPVICNEVRRGSFATAIQTAKGGEETKFVIRVFQNTKIVADDCGSNDYLLVTLTKDSAKDYLYRNIMVNGVLVTLNDDNIGNYIGKTVQIRSPLYCHTPEGYCFTCMGELFRSIDQELVTMVGVAVTSSFTKAALKSKHFTLARGIHVNSLNQFVV